MDGDRAFEKRLGLGELVLRGVEIGERRQRHRRPRIVGAVARLGQFNEALLRRRRLGEFAGLAQLIDLLFQRVELGLTYLGRALLAVAGGLLGLAVALPRRPAFLRLCRIGRKHGKQCRERQNGGGSRLSPQHPCPHPNARGEPACTLWLRQGLSLVIRRTLKGRPSAGQGAHCPPNRGA